MALLRFLTRDHPDLEPKETLVRFGEVDITVITRYSRRAKRLSLRLDSSSGALMMVLPIGLTEREGFAFLRRQEAWILEQIASLPAASPFAEGGTIPYRGEDRVIRHDADHRYGVTIGGEGEIRVAGPREHLARRLRDHCRKEARSRITPKAHDMAGTIGRKAGRITIRDQKTRWGSCSANGDMSFNWRLILAPDWVLHYVVAHEVAHLIERNHSPRFWDLVRRIDPDMAEGRKWLRNHGQRLQRVG